jgi:hypothetical protein
MTLVAFGTATVSTDKKRYFVGETMNISDSGSTPQVLVNNVCHPTNSGISAAD